jgi:hypothetical protein
MAARWTILVGVAITGGIAWFALHRGGSSDARTGKGGTEGSDGSSNVIAQTGSGGSDAAKKLRDGKIDLSTPEHPMHVDDPSTALPAPGTKFEAQARDPEWAPKTETEIKRRFSTGVRRGKLDATECHHDQCLLTMSGTQDDMSTAMADLETEGGLLYFADHIILGGPEERDGKLVIKVYAVFDRRASDTTN